MFEELENGWTEEKKRGLRRAVRMIWLGTALTWLTVLIRYIEKDLH